MNLLMEKKVISIPELSLFAGTRAILGFGIALLLADRLNAPQRKAVGWVMVAIGAVSTIPLAMEILGASSQYTQPDMQSNAAA